MIAQLAKDAGIEKASDYQSMQNQMKNHNEENIYGLTNMEMADYYDYIYAGLESELMEYLKKENPVTEEELRQIYEEKQEEYTSDVSVELLVAEIQAETDTALCQKIAEKLEETTDVEELSALYPEADFYTITLSSLNPQEGKTGVYTQRWEVASRMEQDSICEPFYADSHILIMRCLKREENVLQSFEEIQGVLESQVLTANAKAAIRSEIEKAEITENVDLEKITLEAVK